jgi:hypothetical protein
VISRCAQFTNNPHRHQEEARAAGVEPLNELEHITAPGGELEQQHLPGYKAYACWLISALDELVADAMSRVEHVAASGAGSPERAEAQRTYLAMPIDSPN